MCQSSFHLRTIAIDLNNELLFGKRNATGAHHKERPASSKKYDFHHANDTYPFNVVHKFSKFSDNELPHCRTLPGSKLISFQRSLGLTFGIEQI